MSHHLDSHFSAHPCWSPRPPSESTAHQCSRNLNTPSSRSGASRFHTQLRTVLTRVRETTHSQPTAESLAPRLQTGDLILFSSAGVRPALTRLATSSKWDHTALVLVDAVGAPWVFEATGDGVSLHPFVERVTRARAKEVAVRKLIVPSGRSEVAQRAWRFAEEMKGRPYEATLDMLCAGLGLQVRHDDLRSVFCSELVAAAYRAMGLFPPSLVAANLLPRHFSSSAAVPLPFLEGVRLAREQTLQLSGYQQRLLTAARAQADEAEEQRLGPGARVSSPHQVAPEVRPAVGWPIAVRSDGSWALTAPLTDVP